MRPVKALVRVLVRLTIVAIVGAAVSGVVALIKGSDSSSTPVTYDQWPDVPTNPDAS